LGRFFTIFSAGFGVQNKIPAPLIHRFDLADQEIKNG
jgi:hypothetical protein